MTAPDGTDPIVSALACAARALPDDALARLMLAHVQARLGAPAPVDDPRPTARMRGDLVPPVAVRPAPRRAGGRPRGDARRAENVERVCQAIAAKGSLRSSDIAAAAGLGMTVTTVAVRTALAAGRITKDAGKFGLYRASRS